jgi:signal transduction histidine kinase
MKRFIIFVLFNLIKNALYYFKLHPQATLTITIQPSTVKVKDTGPGMSEEALSQLISGLQDLRGNQGVRV